MRHYLLYSSSAHFLLLAVIFFASRNSLQLQKKETYYIDFIGPSRIVTMEKAAIPEGRDGPAAAKAAKTPKRPAAENPEAGP